MNDDQRFDFYKAQYQKEWDERETLNNQLRIPLTVVAVLFGFLAYIFRNIDFNSLLTGSAESLLFSLFYIASLFCIGKSIYHLIKSYHGYTYEALPTPKESEDYYQELLDTYEEFDDQKETADYYFRKYLKDYYVNLTDNNAKINEKKGYNMYRANTFIVATLVFAFLAFVPFQIDQIETTSNGEAISSSPCKAAEVAE